jgi:hypothetical protein
LDTFVLKADCGGALLRHHTRALNGVKSLFTDRAVVADSLDVEETSVGPEADLPECGKRVCVRFLCEKRVFARRPKV